jgi:septum site-determining protein MinD
MRIISVISGKGGVGKTTTVSNLCAAFTIFQKNVIAIDGNLSGPNLGLHCGVYSSLYTLKDAIEGEVPLEKTICTSPSGIKIIPAPISFSTPDLSLDGVKDSLRRLEGDLILVDSAPGLGKEIYPTLDITDEVLIVTNPEIPAVTEALRAVEVCRLRKIPVTGVVLNRIRKEKHELPLREIRNIFDVPILATVPEDPKVRESIAAGNPVVFYSPSSRAAVEFKRLAGLLIGYRYKPGLIEKIKSLLKLRREKPIEIGEVLKKQEVSPEEAETPPSVPLEESKVEAPPTSLVILKANLKVIETTLEKLEKRFEEGRISEETYKKLKDKFTAELEKVKEDIKRAEGEEESKSEKESKDEEESELIE